MARKETIADGIDLYLGDCREILPTLGKVDAVVTDPPYGISLRNHALADEGTNSSKRIRRDYAITGDEDLSVAHAVIGWAREQAETIVAFASPRHPLEGPWRSLLVWDKGGAVGAGGDPGLCWKQTWELIHVSNKRDLQGRRDPSVLKFYITPQMMSDHPAQKPVDLISYLIDKTTTSREQIVDPFMGSGTTGVSAVKLGRRFVGIEIEQKYFDIACSRIDAIARQGSLFGTSVHVGRI